MYVKFNEIEKIGNNVYKNLIPQAQLFYWYAFFEITATKLSKPQRPASASATQPMWLMTGSVMHPVPCWEPKQPGAD